MVRVKFLPKDGAKEPSEGFLSAQTKPPEGHAVSDDSRRPGTVKAKVGRLEKSEKLVFETQADAPLCHKSESIMVGAGRVTNVWSVEAHQDVPDVRTSAFFLADGYQWVLVTKDRWSGVALQTNFRQTEDDAEAAEMGL